MGKPVILTGLRANNDLHLGNYLGALLPMVDMANTRSNEYQINLFIPDLHSFTTPIDHGQLQDQIMQNARVFVAAGLNLDDASINLYRQSYIPAHSELTVILNSFTGMGEMSRMTQFKDKAAVKFIEDEENKLLDEYAKLAKEVNLKEYSKTDDLTLKKTAEISNDIILIKDKTLSQNYEELFRNNPILYKTVPLLDQLLRLRKFKEAAYEFVSVGLFDYPVLMAADILLYGATYVPVGDDQTQHLEFTRDIAERMNTKFGNLFEVPKPVSEQHKFFGKDQGLRVRDLQDPTKKMSKSDETGKGVIFLNDDPEVAKKKIMSAPTDDLAHIAHDYENQPGIANLLDIYQHLGGDTAEFLGQQQYGEFKRAVGEKLAIFLGEFQERLASVDDAKLAEKLQASEAAMREQANVTLSNVQSAVGLRP